MTRCGVTRYNNRSLATGKLRKEAAGTALASDHSLERTALLSSLLRVSAVRTIPNKEGKSIFRSLTNLADLDGDSEEELRAAAQKLWTAGTDEIVVGGCEDGGLFGLALTAAGEAVFLVGDRAVHTTAPLQQTVTKLAARLYLEPQVRRRGALQRTSPCCPAAAHASHEAPLPELFARRLPQSSLLPPPLPNRRRPPAVAAAAATRRRSVCCRSRTSWTTKL